MVLSGRSEMKSRYRNRVSTVLRRKVLWIVLAFLTISIIACGKDRDEEIKASRRMYSSLIKEVLDIYDELHPLRSSRLGFHQSDSLLFTFSSEKRESYTKRLEKLQQYFKKLAVFHLEEREIVYSTLMLHWLKGELFAFKTLQSYRRSPLLYCWMVEEALYGIPSRLEPPYEAELAAYEKRLSQIPLLLQNATALLEKVPGPHTNGAVKRLSRLLDRFDDIEEMVAERYSDRVANLDAVRNSITDFRNFLSNNYLKQSGGIRILGLEYLSRIFLYDELLEIDPNKITEEAERWIKRLRSHASSIRQKLEITNDRNSMAEAEKPDSESLDRRISRIMTEIEDKVSRQKLLGGDKTDRLAIAFKTGIRQSYDLPINPYLTVPPTEDGNVMTAVTPISPGDHCQSFLLVSPRDSMLADVEILYHLLKESSPIRRVDLMLCENIDTVAVLFASKTYRQGWMFFQIEDLLTSFPEEKLELELLLLDEKVRALVRTVTVMKLHAGILTTEAAVDYISEVAGLSKEEAESDVVLASASPSIAYPGISLILLEEMVKKVSYSKGIRNPRREARQLLYTNHHLPLSVILDMIQVD